ncbi:Metallo-dependent phosphatase-like protein, partial [Halteromyces radiatus]|uniref:Metallo-dependent phosphatase-like protein n=1 Tax=Halteromyces radiatus TaxID=101107 RepID=UPI00221E8093
IAIEGCCHGQLDDIYGTIKLLEQKDNIKVDLVLICGDFQAIRNRADLLCMAVPEKYRELGTFWKYYAGLVKAPYPTIFIGGNHEASNYLWELYHGGWVCDNIYYLGNAGVIQYNGIRIGGLSGIFGGRDYYTGHYEHSPYSPSDLRSVYHYREYDVKKLLQIRQPMDIFLSHDWPRGVERYGDLASLLQVRSNTLGSKPNEELLTHLKPDYWFAAHLHVKYAALVDHDKWKYQSYSSSVRDVLGLSSTLQQVQGQDEGNNNNENKQSQEPQSMEDEQMEQNDSSSRPQVTRFLSLDKCLPRRSFLQVVDVPAKNEDGFTFDLEWLAITRAMQPYLSVQYQPIPMPPEEEVQRTVQQEAMYLDMQLDADALELKIPNNFTPTSRPHQLNLTLTRDEMHQYRKFQFNIYIYIYIYMY